MTDVFVNRLFKVVEHTTVQDPHPGLIIATHHFNKPYPSISEIEVLSLAALDLLNQYGYPSISDYVKLIISLTMKHTYGEEITFTTGRSIPLTSQDGSLLPKNEIYARVNQLFLKNAEIYNGCLIVKLFIQELSEIEPLPASEIRKIKHNPKQNYPGYIKALKRKSNDMKPFMVSDLETILIDNKHTPYVAGLMLVHPCQDIKESIIYTYFSEDYSFIEDFKERSKKVLFDLVFKIKALMKKEKKAKTVYFHNFSRFDGVIMLRYLVCHTDYNVKPLMRNGRLYELEVYSDSNLLFCFRDSLNLLPGKLDKLAKNLCPSLGSKGSIDYENPLNSKGLHVMKSLYVQ
ncbi:hypothetical protein L1987_48402 [Smallanthus sonchifolius]|uniref:Uncharacterized protein n=1 Tax=Smallanthus sonchifolius TaxID=185202 RepID=A0ACB9FSH7_9ASTR|nr:hypothetical protein L1987_48402 [Smallanthus sonchifolius]